jgi:acetylornithine deacetylase
LNDLERLEKIFELVDEEEVIQFTKDICSFPSYSGQETECAKFIANYMKENGFEVELQEVEAGRFQTICRIKGSGEAPSLMFNGHMDVGPVKMFSWTKRDPYKAYVRDGRIHVHGIENMKGGVAAMIMAAVALKRSGIKLEGDLVVCPVVGELQGGVGSKHLVDSGVITDYALVPEPSGLTIRTATAGCVQFLIHVFGLDKRINALDGMIKVIEALKEASRTKDFTFTPFPKKPDLPIIQIGGIIGGVGRDHSFYRCPPVFPDFCTLGIDVRIVPGQTENSMKNDLIRLLSRLKVDDPDFHFEVEGPPATYTEQWPNFKHFIPPANLPSDDRIVQVLAKNHELIMGEKATIWTMPHQNAYNDCGHLQAAGIKAVTYGPSYMPLNRAIIPTYSHGSADARGFSYPDGTGEDCMEIFQIVTTMKVYITSAIDICMNSKE